MSSNISVVLQSTVCNLQIQPGKNEVKISRQVIPLDHIINKPVKRFALTLRPTKNLFLVESFLEYCSFLVVFLVFYIAYSNHYYTCNGTPSFYCVYFFKTTLKLNVSEKINKNTFLSKKL